MVVTYRFINPINRCITVVSSTLSPTLIVKTRGNLEGFRILCISNWTKNRWSLES